MGVPGRGSDDGANGTAEPALAHAGGAHVYRTPKEVMQSLVPEGFKSFFNMGSSNWTVKDENGTHVGTYSWGPQSHGTRYEAANVLIGTVWAMSCRPRPDWAHLPPLEQLPDQFDESRMPPPAKKPRR